MKPGRWIPLLILLLAACGGASPSNETTVPLPTLIPLEDSASQTTPVAGQTAIPGTLPFWTAVSGSLPQDTLWQFTAEAGEAITLRAVGQGIDILLSLLDENGVVLGEGRVIEAVLPVSGRYLVLVSSTDGAAIGTYELGLSRTGQANPNDITPTAIPVLVGIQTPVPASADLGIFIAELADGETRAGELTADDTQHVYTFSGEAGRFTTLELTRVSGADEFDPLLTLYSPDGQPLAVDGDSGVNQGAVVRNILLNTDGFYTLQVNGRSTRGVYSILLTLSDQPLPITPTVVVEVPPTRVIPVFDPTLPAAQTGVRLQSHQPVSGVLATAEDIQRHTFEVIAGEVITLGVIPAEESALIPLVELYDPDGVPVAAVSGLNTPNTREVIIPAYPALLSGPYTAFVTAEGASFGAYSIGYGVGSSYREILRGEVLADQPAEGSAMQRGVRDAWFAVLRQGDVITAGVQVAAGSGGFEPVLELVSDTGELLGIDSISGGAGRPLLTGITIPRDGLYYFRVRAAQVDRIGGYRLIWRYVDVAPTVTPPRGITRILTIKDSIAEGVYQFYPFQGRAGQQLRISVVAAFGSSLDPVVALLNSDAVVIAEGDDSDNSLNPLVYTTIPADGTYTVRVNGYLSGGDYEVLVEELVPLQ